MQVTKIDALTKGETDNSMRTNEFKNMIMTKVSDQINCHNSPLPMKYINFNNRNRLMKVMISQQIVNSIIYDNDQNKRFMPDRM